MLSKVDTVDDAQPFVESVQAACLSVSAHRGAGLDALRAWIGDRTVALLGSSGVGKSSLINALLGEKVRDTGDISDVDLRGQHTTTSRDLLLLPGGGCLIDTPGMRELGLADDADPDEAFVEIAALAETCAYRDCTHEHEPGCAVQAAVQDGTIAEERVRSYHKLKRELAHERRRADQRSQRARGKAFHKRAKAAQQLKRDRGW